MASEKGMPSGGASELPARRRVLTRLVIGSLGATLRIGPSLRRLFYKTGRFALSAIAIVAILPLLHPSTETALAHFTHAKEFSIAAASLIGTVLVLAFSLSMIPVQRAAESMPVSVVRLFARDPTNALISLALGSFCLLSFCLALYETTLLPRRFALLLQVLVVGLTFDAVRWHHRHTLSLLEPVRAVSDLRNQALRFVRTTDRRVRLAARVQWMVLPRASRNQTSRNELAGVLYRNLPNHALILAQSIQELEEAALRAMEQVETRVAVSAVDALAAIGHEYLVRRRDTLRAILVDPLGVYESDAREVLTPLHESLKRAGQRAVALKSEPIAIRVVQGLGQLALICTTLKLPGVSPERAPLTPLPLIYLEQCALAGLAEGLHDLGLDAARVMAEVSLSAPHDTDLNDVHIVVANAILHIVGSFLDRQQTVLANLCLEDCLRSVWGVVRTRHYEAGHYVRHVFDELVGIIPVAVRIEANTGRNPLTTPLAPPYDTANGLAVVALLGSVSEARPDGRRSPFWYLEELSEQFHRHLRNIAEDIDLGDCSLTWHIVRSIWEMSQVFAALVRTSPPEHVGSGRGLAKKHLPWYLVFHCVCFSKMQRINLQTARKATESLGAIALTYIDCVIPEVVHSAIENIGAVAEAYGKLGQVDSEYAIGDLLRPLLCIERFAAATNNSELIARTQSAIDKVMALFQGDVKGAVRHAIEVRRSQVLQELRDPHARFRGGERPVDLLAHMLRDRGVL
jgi:hypothetical protein